MPTAPSQPTASAQEAKQETTEQPVTVVAGPGEVHYDDMKTHNKDNDCWMAIHGKVSILRIPSNLPTLQVR
jgi:cytochrome b involved in lipid metabolism